MADAETQAFVLFCEDVRRESRGKQSLLGVLGGALFLDEGTEKVEKLTAVLIARIKNTRSVNISLFVNAYVDSRVLGPDQPYSATFVQDEDDHQDAWTLQLAADLSGMPLGKTNVVSVTFKVNETEATASLPIFFGEGDSIRDGVIKNEIGGQADRFPPPKRKRLPKPRKLAAKAMTD